MPLCSLQAYSHSIQLASFPFQRYAWPRGVWDNDVMIVMVHVPSVCVYNDVYIVSMLWSVYMCNVQYAMILVQYEIVFVQYAICNVTLSLCNVQYETVIMQCDIVNMQYEMFIIPCLPYSVHSINILYFPYSHY